MQIKKGDKMKKNLLYILLMGFVFFYSNNSLALEVKGQTSYQYSGGFFGSSPSGKDKQEAIKILDDTINMHSEKEVQDTARSVKALMSFSS